MAAATGDGGDDWDDFFRVHPRQENTVVEGTEQNPLLSPRPADLLGLNSNGRDDDSRPWEAVAHTPLSPHPDHREREGKREIRTQSNASSAKTKFAGDLAVAWEGKLTGKMVEIDPARCYVFVHRQKSLFGAEAMEVSFDHDSSGDSRSPPIGLKTGQSLVFSTPRHGAEVRRGLQLHVRPPSGQYHSINVYVDFHKTPFVYIRLVPNSGGLPGHGGVSARVMNLSDLRLREHPQKKFVHVPTHAEFHRIIDDNEQDSGDVVQTPHDNAKGKVATVVAATGIALLALVLLI
jgi:hypothetical protein